MLENFTAFKTISLRRVALAGALALASAAAFVGNAAPAAAMRAGGGGGGFHGGGGGFHGGSFGGGFHGHNGFGFRRGFGFRHRFAFFGGGYPYGYDDGCLNRVWGPYGWRLVNVCY